MSLCPESEYRASLTDAEFWEHVLIGPDAGRDYDPDDDPNAPRPEDPELMLVPCVVCGTLYAACGYDEEGRPMVHATPEEENG